MFEGVTAGGYVSATSIWHGKVLNVSEAGNVSVAQVLPALKA